MANIIAGSGNISLYPSADDLQSKIDEYFETCYIRKRDPKLGIDRDVEIDTPTWSGLARYLGFTSRSALLNYAKQRNFRYSDVISAALLRLEEVAEKKLMTTKTNSSGIMAVLRNNADWGDVSSTRRMSDESGRPLSFTWASAPVEGDVVDASVKTVEPEKSTKSDVVETVTVG